MELNQFDIGIEYKCGKYKFVAENENEHFSLRIDEISGENRLKLYICPKQPMELLGFRVVYKRPFEENSVVFVNGYQSWTTSREWKKTDRQRGLSPICTLPIARNYAQTMGDYFFKSYSKDAGVFHGYTYSYVRTGDAVELIGSLSDRTGWTILNYDMNKGRIVVEKEVEGLTVDGEYNILDIACFRGEYNEVFDSYFAAMNIDKPRVNHMSGYTSWYNYFQAINKDIILRDLDGLSRVGDNADIFQIDDGFETMVGDWHSIDPVKFPDGLRPIVDKIHSKGYKAGLWLAPFVAQFKAQVIKDHPDWILRDKKGKKVYAGVAWGGSYALDFYKPECAAYINGCFDEVFDEWDFDMVKLDFLYAACMEPRDNKTRGQIMYEAVDFLRECCRDKLILGCGVPLAPAFGTFDLCRISCDAELSFKEKIYAKCTNQEIISTKDSMNNSIFRRHLDGRAFVNDPDVFFLRNDNAKYNLSQKVLLAKINNMFGNILFVSDNIGDYDADQLDLLASAYKKCEAKVLSAEYIGDRSVQVVYSLSGKTIKLVFDTISGEFREKELN